MKQWISKTVLSGLVLFFAWSRVNGQVSLPAIFGDSMVLQRDAPLRIWGRAAAGEQVSVQFHLQNKTVKADKNGEWNIMLSPEKAGGPFSLSVKGKNSILLKGILMGDVWLCSGQSNMEFPVKGWSSVENADQEIANASHPRIRLFTVDKQVAALPDAELKSGTWQSCSPASIAPFSAVGYFFGRALQRKLDVPVGLINSTWGGTQIEAWISHRGLVNDAHYRQVMQTAPEMAMQDLMKKRTEAEQQYLALLQRGLPDVSDSSRWKTFSYEDRQWTQMSLPGLWESQKELSRLDGVVWFRKHFSLDAAEAGRQAVLHLGMIDDSDETYVNGVKVGGLNGWNTSRTYPVATGLLKPGDNVIAVRVEDFGAGGGIYGEAADLRLDIDGQKHPLAGNWLYRVEKLAHNSNGIGPNDYPSLLYNGMIQPFENLTLKGVIWYQGEANESRASEYRYALPLLIKDWRMHFEQENLPFYFVQLTSYNSGNGNSNKGSTWAELRESQAKTLKVPATGMAVTIDIGDAKDIHPRNKKDVGERLAALALKNTYGKKIISSGPVYRSLRVNGSVAKVWFSSAGKGLMAKGNDGSLAGFELAGEDRHFYPAEAVISGDSVLLSSKEVPRPVAVRYAWSDDAGKANLFNKNDWPAAPFRTDDWPLMTSGNRYDPAFK